MKLPPVLVVADRGQMKIFMLDHRPTLAPRPPSPRLVDICRVEEAHQKYDERFTDQAGAFPNKGSAGNGNSMAERLPLEKETDSRIFRRLANKLADFLREHDSPTWAFAAPPEINGNILENLNIRLRRSLRQNVLRDLTNVPAAELWEHFETAEALTE
jgi:hypothetical protein